MIFFKLSQLWSIFINQKCNARVAIRKVLICSKYSNKHVDLDPSEYRIKHFVLCLNNFCTRRFIQPEIITNTFIYRSTSTKSRAQIQVAVAIHAILFSLAKSTCSSFNIRSNESTGMMTITAATSGPSVAYELQIFDARTSFSGHSWSRGQRVGGKSSTYLARSDYAKIRWRIDANRRDPRNVTCIFYAYTALKCDIHIYAVLSTKIQMFYD